jgi:hypothetical protein
MVADNARQTYLSGFKSGPCPRCGGMGHFPDGIYDFVDNAITLLQGPERSASELERIAAILREARQKGTSSEELKRQIRDEIPELKSLGDLLPKTRPELYAFIALLIAILTLLLSDKNKSNASKLEANQVITNVIEESAPPPPGASLPKVGRNVPCPCGSGKKFKYCHGRPTSRRS